MADTVEAVNEILQSIGESPTTLTTEAAIEAATDSIEYEALQFLSQYNIKVQRDGPGILGGWYCNTQINAPYESADVDGDLRIEFTDGEEKVTPAGISCWRHLVKRYDPTKAPTKRYFLWDVEDQTYVMESSPIYLTVTRTVPFEEILETLAQYVTFMAAWKFQRFKKRGAIDNAEATQEMMNFRRIAIQEDSDLRGPNVLETREAIAVKGFRWPWGNNVSGRTLP